MGSVLLFAIFFKMPLFDLLVFIYFLSLFSFLRLEFFWGGREAAGHTDPCVPEEIRMTCQQFVHYHRDHCVKSIVKGRR